MPAGARSRTSRSTSSDASPADVAGRDAVANMRRERRRHRLHDLEPGRLAAVEEAHPAPEEHRDEMEVQLVQEPAREALLHERRAAGNRDVLPARGRPRLLD